jgi:hypothetical protein
LCNPNTRVIWTPRFEWYVVRCGSKNKHQKDVCLEDIELRAQDMIGILGPVVNVIRGYV